MEDLLAHHFEEQKKTQRYDEERSTFRSRKSKRINQLKNLSLKKLDKLSYESDSSNEEAVLGMDEEEIS